MQQSCFLGPSCAKISKRFCHQFTAAITSDMLAMVNYITTNVLGTEAGVKLGRQLCKNWCNPLKMIILIILNVSCVVLYCVGYIMCSFILGWSLAFLFLSLHDWINWSLFYAIEGCCSTLQGNAANCSGWTIAEGVLLAVFYRIVTRL